MKQFSQLSEREILALAVDAEDDDHRVYSSFAEDLHESYPGTAKIFADMADVEASHRDTLLKTYRTKFGPNLLPIRRADVRGFMKRRPVWLVRNLTLPQQIRDEVDIRETEAYNFYLKAAAQAQDPAIKTFARRSRRGRKRPRGHRGRHSGRISEYPAEREKEDARQKRKFRSAIHPARSRRIDGRLGLDAGAALRRGFRDA